VRAGASGPVLMGFDGIPVDQYLAADAVPDLQLIAVEYANVLKENPQYGRGASTSAPLKRWRSALTACSSCQFITPEYFVATSLRHDGNSGRSVICSPAKPAICWPRSS